MPKYNHCQECHQWMGWFSYLIFWEKDKTCLNCLANEEEDEED